MHKLFVIIRREYTQVVKKKSFLIGLFITPLFIAAFMLLPALLATREPSHAESICVIDRGTQDFGSQFVESLNRYTLKKSGGPAYEVKHLYRIPAGDTLTYNAVFDSLTTAIADKELQYLLVIGPWHGVPDSSTFLVANTNNFITQSRFERRLTDLFSMQRLRESNINLPVDSILTLTSRFDLPVEDTKAALGGGEVAIPFEIKYFAALVLVMLIYMMVIFYGQTLMRSVIEEKSSRIMEVLVSSASPFQMMMGKVLGMGAAALTQVSIWVLLGAGVFVFSNAMSLELDPSISRIVSNPLIVVFFVLFLVGGYLLYSAIFALIGSIVNSDKEAQNFIFPVVMLLILSVMVGMSLVQNPDAGWALALSCIP
ncbi:MAG: ABC transporter permease, partial [Candidatus Zixiibacteriota bacterium]